MPTIDTTSDLLEVTFTRAELNQAMQLCDSHLSQMYLQNIRVQVFRAMTTLKFNPAERADSEVQHVYLSGQLKILDDLIAGIHNPTPIEEPEVVSPQQALYQQHLSGASK